MVIATLLVIATIISNGADRYSMHSEKLSVIDFLSLILLPLLAWGTAQAQKAANIADDDAEGLANDKLSTANYIWIALFGFIWVAILYGLYVYLTVVV